MRALMLSWALLALTGRFLTAQSDSTSPPTQITGFESLPWGARLSAVTEKYGPPETTKAGGDGLTAYGFKASIADEAAEVFVLLDDRRGLVKGSYYVAYGSGDDCEETYGRIRDAIIDRYPAITPLEIRRNESDGLDLCGAIKAGQATRMSLWKDPGGDAAITMQLNRELESLVVAYEGPLFAAAIRQLQPEPGARER